MERLLLCRALVPGAGASHIIPSPKLQGALIADPENYGLRRGSETKIGRGRAGDVRKFVSENRPSDLKSMH